MYLATNWASLCRWARCAVVFQQWDGTSVVGKAEIKYDFDIVKSDYDTYQQLDNFLVNYDYKKQGRRAVIRINGGSGSVYWARVMCNLLAYKSNIISLTWGGAPITSAGHNYWYDWRLRSAWLDRAAFLLLHSCTSGNNSDLRFYSNNVHAMNSLHDHDSYTRVLSINSNSSTFYDTLDKNWIPTGYRSLRKQVREVMSRTHFDVSGDSIDYVELFSNRSEDIISEVLPARAMAISHSSKVIEELYEFQSGIRGSERRMMEGFDLLHTIMCAIACHDEVFVSDLLLAYVDGDTLSNLLTLALLNFATELVDHYSSDVKIMGLLRNWEKNATRRNRPVPVISMMQFLVYVCHSRGIKPLYDDYVLDREEKLDVKEAFNSMDLRLAIKDLRAIVSTLESEIDSVTGQITELNHENVQSH